MAKIIKTKARRTAAHKTTTNAADTYSITVPFKVAYDANDESPDYIDIMAARSKTRGRDICVFNLTETPASFHAALLKRAELPAKARASIAAYMALPASYFLDLRVQRYLQVFTGNANRALAESIVREINRHLLHPITLGAATVRRFSDGEVSVQFNDNVRDNDCYVVQPTCGPVNDNLMELLVMVDALRRASAGAITAVLPYYGYARQDRKSAPRTPITSKLVADMIVAAGVTRVVTVDLHAPQIQGFFNIPSDHLYAMPALLPALAPWYGATIVSPDAGGVERARAYAKRLEAELVIIDKRRERANESEVMNIIGDVSGRECLIVDDMIDTAGTLVNAANALIKAGAKSVSAAASHGVFSGAAAGRVMNSPLHDIIVTDSIPLSNDMLATGKVRVASLGPLLGNAIRHIHDGGSVSSLFV